jgi:hypothetical protein
MKAVFSYILVFGVLLTCFSAQANLIVNGGFENTPDSKKLHGRKWDHFKASAYEGWEGSNIEVWNNLFKVGGAGAHGGMHAELNAHGSRSGFSSYTIFQLFDTVASSQYLLEFHHTARNSMNKEKFHVYVLDGVFEQDVRSGTSKFDDMNMNVLLSEEIHHDYRRSWQSFSQSFTARSESTILLFTSLNGGSTVGNLIDEVSVTAVPAPSAFGLLVLALVGLSSRQLRRVV